MIQITPLRFFKEASRILTLSQGAVRMQELIGNRLTLSSTTTCHTTLDTHTFALLQQREHPYPGFLIQTESHTLFGTMAPRLLTHDDLAHLEQIKAPHNLLSTQLENTLRQAPGVYFEFPSESLTTYSTLIFNEGETTESSEYACRNATLATYFDLNQKHALIELAHEWKIPTTPLLDTECASTATTLFARRQIDFTAEERLFLMVDTMVGANWNQLCMLTDSVSEEVKEDYEIRTTELVKIIPSLPKGSLICVDAMILPCLLPHIN